MLEDFDVAAIKIGMLGSAEIVGAVAEALGSPSPRSRGEGCGEGQARSAGFAAPAPHPALRATFAEEKAARFAHRSGRGTAAFIVYDPVMIASSGEALSGAGFVEAVRLELLPLVDCLTPNLAEAAALLGETGRREAKPTWRARARRC